jgi:hypothetical protein
MSCEAARISRPRTSAVLHVVEFIRNDLVRLKNVYETEIIGIGLKDAVLIISRSLLNGCSFVELTGTGR